MIVQRNAITERTQDDIEYDRVKNIEGIELSIRKYGCLTVSTNSTCLLSMSANSSFLSDLNTKVTYKN